MSIMIRISYRTDKELDSVVERLSDLGLELETVKDKTGFYRRAYLKEAHPHKPVFDIDMLDKH